VTVRAVGQPAALPGREFLGSPSCRGAADDDRRLARRPLGKWGNGEAGKRPGKAFTVADEKRPVCAVCTQNLMTVWNQRLAVRSLWSAEAASRHVTSMRPKRSSMICSDFFVGRCLELSQSRRVLSSTPRRIASFSCDRPRRRRTARSLSGKDSAGGKGSWPRKRMVSEHLPRARSVHKYLFPIGQRKLGAREACGGLRFSDAAHPRPAVQ
jgi:hypothetical protein